VTGLLQVAVPNHLGDAVMAMPFLRRLCRALPNHEVRLVGRPLPGLVLDDQGPWQPVSPTWRREAGTALLLAPSFRVAWQAVRSGALLRVGIPSDWRRLLLTHSVETSVRECHQRDVYRQLVDKTLSLLQAPTEDGASSREGATTPALGGFQADPAGREWWEAVGSPELLLHPWAAGSAAKRWPLHRWVELGRSFPSVAVTGGPSGDDARFAQAVAAALEAPCAAGSTALSPRAWASLAQAVPQLVLPDTGLAHLASAAGACPVVLFGGSDPARYAPERAQVLAADSMEDLAVGPLVETLLVKRASAIPGSGDAAR